jgi:hypothetical protein
VAGLCSTNPNFPLHLLIRPCPRTLNCLVHTTSLNIQWHRPAPVLSSKRKQESESLGHPMVSPAGT